MMKHRFKRQSALALADDHLVRAVGKAMITFAAIEGAVNFQLSFLIKNHVLWTRFADTSITRRLDLLAGLLLQARIVEKEDIRKVVSQAKKLFKSRNLVAHNPLVTSGNQPEPRIHKLGGGKRKELSASDVLQIAEDADEVYDEILDLCISEEAIEKLKAKQKNERKFFETLEYVEYQEGEPLLRKWFGGH
jgi:hypothetical protein